MLDLGATRDTAQDSPPGRHEEGRTELRQLRHLTKNALQRILVQVMEVGGTEKSAVGRSLAREIERRIKLSAAISDALFGLTRSPGTLYERLGMLCRSVIDLYADPAQIIHLELSVKTNLARRLEPTVLGIAQELVGNAVKHGLHMRLLGRIRVSLENGGEGCAVLSVANDGWPIEGELAEGEGLQLVSELAGAVGGRMRIAAVKPVRFEVRLPLGERQ